MGMNNNNNTITGADPGFQIRGGGEALKKIAPSGEMREFFLGYFV